MEDIDSSPTTKKSNPHKHSPGFIDTEKLFEKPDRIYSLALLSKEDPIANATMRILNISALHDDIEELIFYGIPKTENNKKEDIKMLVDTAHLYNINSTEEYPLVVIPSGSNDSSIDAIKHMIIQNKNSSVEDKVSLTIIYNVFST